MQVVIDTNVFVDGMLIAESEPRAVLRLVKKNEVALLVTIPIVDEIVNTVLRLCRSNGYDHVQPMIEVTRAIAAARLVEPLSYLKGIIPDDPEDEKFVTCAYYGDAGYIISGDKHLLDISGTVKNRAGKPIIMIRPEHFGTELLKKHPSFGQLVRR